MRIKFNGKKYEQKIKKCTNLNSNLKKEFKSSVCVCFKKVIIMGVFECVSATKMAPTESTEVFTISTASTETINGNVTMVSFSYLFIYITQLWQIFIMLCYVVKIR